MLHLVWGWLPITAPTLMYSNSHPQTQRAPHPSMGGALLSLREVCDCRARGSACGEADTAGAVLVRATQPQVAEDRHLTTKAPPNRAGRGRFHVGVRTCG